MGIDERRASKMIANAERQAARERREPRQKQNLERKAGQEFCAACYAVKLDGHCPHCDFGRAVYDKFCRRCLTVHRARKLCKAWRPER